MSKLRRSIGCSRNRNKVSNDGISDIPSTGKLKLNKSKLMSHGEFLNRIQKSLYYGSSKAKMSIPLSDYIADKFSETHNGYSLNRLNYSTIGNLSSTPCSLILAMIYLERLKDADPAYTKHVTPTELFLVSMMVATKFYSGHDDEAPYVNWAEKWAECINTTPDDLLQIELSFLNAIDWKVYVSNEEFFEKVKALEMVLAQQQGMMRGFYTYLELSSLLSPSIQIAKQFIQSILVLSLSYTVLVTTMVASVFLASQIPGTYLNASSRSSDELSSGNSSSQQQIKINDVTNMLSTTNELIEPASDLDVLLNLALDRLNETSELVKIADQPNTTTRTSSFYSTWYSLLEIHSFKWPVLDDYEINSNFFCNSSSSDDILASQPNTDRFEFGFNGIKIKWA